MPEAPEVPTADEIDFETATGVPETADESTATAVDESLPQEKSGDGSNELKVELSSAATEEDTNDVTTTDEVNLDVAGHDNVEATITEVTHEDSEGPASEVALALSNEQEMTDPHGDKADDEISLEIEAPIEEDTVSLNPQVPEDESEDGASATVSVLDNLPAVGEEELIDTAVTTMVVELSDPFDAQSEAVPDARQEPTPEVETAGADEISESMADAIQLERGSSAAEDEDEAAAQVIVEVPTEPERTSELLPAEPVDLLPADADGGEFVHDTSPTPEEGHASLPQLNAGESVPFPKVEAGMPPSEEMTKVDDAAPDEPLLVEDVTPPDDAVKDEITLGTASPEPEPAVAEGLGEVPSQTRTINDENKIVETVLEIAACDESIDEAQQASGKNEDPALDGAVQAEPVEIDTIPAEETTTKDEPEPLPKEKIGSDSVCGNEAESPLPKPDLEPAEEQEKAVLVEPITSKAVDPNQAPILVDKNAPADITLEVSPDTGAVESERAQALDGPPSSLVVDAPHEQTTKARETMDRPVRSDTSESPNHEPLRDTSTPKHHDFAITDDPAAEQSPRERQRRRHSHRDSKYPRRRESETSTKERPTLGGLAAGVLAAAKLAASTKTKPQDSITERDTTRTKERTREGNKENSNSSKERMYPEHGSHRHREDKHSKRRVLEAMEDDAETRRRRERRAEKAPVGAENSTKPLPDDGTKDRERRERRRAARVAEEERLKSEADRRKQKEEARLAKEDEERRLRHEERRRRHESEKQARRLEQERAEQAERDIEDAKRLRRQRRAERETEKLTPSRPVVQDPIPSSRVAPVELSRDAARRAFEEDQEVAPPPRPTTPPPPPVVTESSPRSAPRRRTSTRDPPPPTKRNSILGGLFGRSKTDPPVTSPRSSRPVARVRSDPVEVPESPARAQRMEKERPKSSHQSSNESRDRVERPHRSRRHSQRQREFKSAAEEAEHYKQKEKRRSARDGGRSAIPQTDELPLPPEPFEPEPEPAQPRGLREFEPLMDDAAAEVGIASTSSAERRERRRSKRASGAEERPKSRRITVTEPERPVSRRIESDRPRTRGHDEERPRARRSETERRREGPHRSSKKEESSGLKSLFGGLKKRIG